MKRFSGICCAWVWSVTLANGVVLLNDSFDYTNGPLVTVSGGTWAHHSPSGSSTGQVEVIAGRVFVNHSESEDVNTVLQGAPYPSSTNLDLYARFSVNFAGLPDGAASSYFAHLKDNTTTGFRARIFTTTNGAPAGMLRIGVGNAGSIPTAVLTNNLSLGSDYAVVIRYVISNATTTVWLDPVSELSPSVTATDSASALTIAAFALRQPTSINDGIGYGQLYLDNLVVGSAFADVATVPTNSPPLIVSQPQSQTVAQGANVAFSVSATGTPPLGYQWQFYATNLAGATSSELVLTNVAATHAGPYAVTVTNAFGATNSQIAMLTVDSLPSAGFSLLTYNVKGNGATDWTTNAEQVRAIARQLQHLNPDIITFNEIPWDLKHEMTNFISAFLPGYNLAVSTGTDGSICSAIASRFSITRSTKWLDGIDLRGFGYSNANNNLDNFTRDLYEAQISVPGFARPLHVFTTHLKSTAGTTYADAAAKRAAEAAAITNFFATNMFVFYPNDPFTLSGDMNDDDTNALSIQQLIGAATGLHLTNPTNPITGSINTYSTSTANPSGRIDYIFPSHLLFLNMASGQVFRTDRLNPLPPNLNSNDCKLASDHLPVLMVFNNPYDKPFRLVSITRSNLLVTFTWQSVPGQAYRVDSSSNLTAWVEMVSNLVGSSATFTLATNVNGDTRYFRVYRVP